MGESKGQDHKKIYEPYGSGCSLAPRIFYSLLVFFFYYHFSFFHFLYTNLKKKRKKKKPVGSLVLIDQSVDTVKGGRGVDDQYLFLVTSLVRNSHNRWFLHMSRQIVRLMCSYQHAVEAPNAINGHTRLGANLLITYCAPCSPFGTGKYGCRPCYISKKNIIHIYYM